jgi:lipopolysaccharide/colanic/teichoic acid biosynthesis glycosyltransferase
MYPISAERLLDLILAGVVLTVSLPILLLLAIAIRLDSHGSVLHRATRIGRGGRAFTLYKFRTMIDGAAAVGPSVTAASDQRVTRVGQVLRRTKLDELPQLWNVLRGDMRLVGPRPEDPRFVALYAPEERLVLSVCPGLTGPSQLTFFDEETILASAARDPELTYVRDILPRKLAIDLEYARRHDLAGDLRIMARTLTVLLRLRDH